MRWTEQDLANRREGEPGKVRLASALRDDDAANLDCPTVGPGQSRLPDVAALPPAQRAANLYTTIPLTLPFKRNAF